MKLFEFTFGVFGEIEKASAGGQRLQGYAGCYATTKCTSFAGFVITKLPGFELGNRPG